MISKDTIARTIVLAIALLNQILAILGKGSLDIAEEDIYQICSLVATIGASLWAWWKNNSFTQAAIIGDIYKDKMKVEQNNVLSEDDHAAEQPSGEEV